MTSHTLQFFSIIIKPFPLDTAFVWEGSSSTFSLWIVLAAAASKGRGCTADADVTHSRQVSSSSRHAGENGVPLLRHHLEVHLGRLRQ